MGVQTQSVPAGHIDSTLLNKAVTALLRYHASTTANSNQLLDDELDIQVQFTLARIPGQPSPKPIRIDIPHPLIKVDGSDDNEDNLQEASVCLIVKEESKPLVQGMISRFPNELSCIKKVLGLQSLRTKHKSYSQKRELLERFDVFLADDRILPMLTKALGGKFFDKKKQPVPINICRKEALPFAVQRCLKGAFMCLSGGTCVTVKTGNTSMSPSHLESNIKAICLQAPLKVPRKWANIKSISIKTTSSVALPIYNKTLEELEEIRADAGINSGVDAKDDVDEETKKVEQDKKRKDLADKSPLARALKKQKSSKKEKAPKDDAEEDEEAAELKTPKEKKVKSKDSDESKSAKKRKDKQLNENEEADETPLLKTPKEKIAKDSESTKKSSKMSKESNAEEAPLKTPKEKKAQTNDDAAKSKSSKKRKDKQPDEDASPTKKAKEIAENGPFIASKKYTGSKKGYVFRKDKMGLGYYRDVLPKVDKAWLASLKNKGGGRKSISHTPKKRKGNSRRSY